MPGREIKVAIIGDPSSLQRALNTADQGVDRFGQRMQQVGGRLRSFGASMTRNLTLPIVGFGVLAFRELNEGAQALAQTQAVLESTGGAARRSLGDIQDLAAELSELSSIDDEELQGMLNKLLTFTNVAGREFDGAASAITDLSVAMGIDLSAAVLQVGKALNDPIRGLTSLTRVGVTFSDRQREWIEHLVEFGDVAGAQRVILAELNREFGGSAEAFGQTPAARLRRLGQRFEELGANILEDALPALEDFAGIIESLADKYDELTPTQQKFVAGAIALAAVLGPLSTAVGLLVSGLGALAAALGISAGLVGALILSLAALAAAIFYLVQNWDQVKIAMQNFVTNAVANVPGAGFAVDQVNFAVQRLREALSFISGVASAAWNALQRLGSVSLGGLMSALSALLGMVRDVVNAVLGLIDVIASAASSLSGLAGRAASIVIPSGALPGPRSVTSKSVGPRSAEERMEQAFRRALRSEVQLVRVAD